MQCGIACLQMICKYFGRDYSLTVLAERCHATKEGVSMLGISQAATTLGLHTFSGRVSSQQLMKAQLPCILYWNQNHFVVLYRIRKGKTFYIADPAKGHVQYSLEEFEKHWLSTRSNQKDKGVAMFIEPMPAFYENEQQKEQQESRSVAFFFCYLRPYYKYLGQIIAGLLIGSVLQLILPFLTQTIVDVGIKNKNIPLIWLILIGQMMLVTGRAAMGFVRSWLLLHINVRINISMLSDFITKLLKLPMSYFDTKLMGDLMQRMGDHRRVESFLMGHTLSIIFSFISFIIFGIVLLVYHKTIFIVFLSGSILYGSWLTLFMKKRKVLDYELFESQAKNNNTTYDLITTMQEIKLQDCEQRRRWEWEDVQVGIAKVRMESLKLQQTQEAGSLLINEIKNIVITVLSATAVVNGELTLGMMMAVQYIIGQLNSPIRQLMSFIYALQDVHISLERINEIHTHKEEDCKDDLLTEYYDRTRGIDALDMSFKYDPHSPKKILNRLNIHIPYGKITAIVGTSGSGKTTLLKLLLGYYELQEGEIQIGGFCLDGIHHGWWRRQCGVVMQDGVIFSESIARNIATSDGEINEERLLRAAEIACIKDYIMSLPLKFNTKVGRDGVGLSQGQKQRLLIARAVYKNPDYIFLDEATNSLDAKNERAIVNNLRNFLKGKTVIIVAHRLSTVRFADQIIVLDQGKVVEHGKHEELVAKKSKYYNLVKNQLELGN